MLDKKHNRVAVIMAGGSGTRFWPASRKKFPKQFLRLLGEESLLDMTVRRMETYVGKGNVFIVIGSDYQGLVSGHLPGFPVENYIFEPMMRDTAAAIGLAATVISRARPGSTMIVCPADHLINQYDNYSKSLDEACKAAECDKNIVIIGIKPDRPATSYGYIQLGKKDSESPAYKVNAFKEKPHISRAEEYLSSGDYYWNAGIFISKADVILGEIKKYAPGISEILDKMSLAYEQDENWDSVKRLFPKIEKISIDYCVMEKSEQILAVRGKFDWDDLGSWNTFAGYVDPEPETGNRFKGSVIEHDSSNCLVVNMDSESGVVAVAGTHNLIVVRTKDAVLVCDRGNDQTVKSIVQKLKNHEDTLKYS